MIKIDITQTQSSQRLEIRGHSPTGSEACARVTSAFEMAATLLYQDRDEYSRENGYSLLVTNVTSENEKQLSHLENYFRQLKELYKNTIDLTVRTL